MQGMRMRWMAMAAGVGTVTTALGACPPAWRVVSETGPVPTTTVMDLAVMLPNGNALIGGARDGSGLGVPRQMLELDAPTHSIIDRTPNLNVRPNGPAAVLQDGRVLIGTNGFTGLGVYDPATHGWTMAASPSASLNFCRALFRLADGRVVGSFNGTSGGSGSIDLLDVQAWRWTNIWRAPVASTNQQAIAFAQLPDGDIVVGGTYDFAPTGWPTVGIARYRPSTNTWTQLGNTSSGAQPFGYPNGVWCMVALPGGDVLVGGTFSSIDGVPAHGIARYQFAGNRWVAVGAGAGARGMAMQTDGTVLVAGEFVFGTPSQFSPVARYDPATNNWTRVNGVPPGMGFSAIAAMSNGEFVYAGWPYNSGNGVRSMVHLGRQPECRADVNCSGGLEPQDIFDYLASWFASEPAADFNGSGSITQQDVFDYVGLWMAGCG